MNLKNTTLSIILFTGLAGSFDSRAETSLADVLATQPE